MKGGRVCERVGGLEVLVWVQGIVVYRYGMGMGVGSRYGCREVWL